MRLYIIIKNLLEKYTSGLLFVVWMSAGFAISLFIVYFRNHPVIKDNFVTLLYILIFSAIWAIISDILKKRGNLNRQIYFILDTFFYYTIYSLLVYYTNGFEGELFFIFFLATISAPFFFTASETLLFLIGLSILTFIIYFFNPQKTIDSYHTGIILLQIFFYFVFAGVAQTLRNKLLKTEEDKRKLSESMVEKCNEEVKEKTKNLEETVNKLKEADETLKANNEQLLGLNNELSFTQDKLKFKIAEMERFNNLAIGRELRMIELKKEIETLKKNLKK